MPRVRCVTCGGTYEQILRDGSVYYHACPPLTVPGPQPNPALPGFTPPTFVERPNKRDENIKIDPETAKSVGMISPGLGVVGV